jgi:Protein of unknown function (DUF938)
VCINMIHISPWSSTLGLFANASKILLTNAPLFLYGPFRRADLPTSTSNEEFDHSLRSRDSRWGLRHLDDVIAVANQQHFAFERLVEMPANNLSVVFRKQ